VLVTVAAPVFLHNPHIAMSFEIICDGRRISSAVLTRRVDYFRVCRDIAMTP
jgi:hypothetical protein